MANSLHRIEHIVVLMLENRSFDHMLGHLKKMGLAVNGVDGSETQPYDPNFPESKTAAIKFDAKRRGQLNKGPGHDLGDVCEQLYGRRDAPFTSPSPNTGFLANYLQRIGGNPADPEQRRRAAEIMKCFDEGSLPVLSRLAREFAVCDSWHSSIPGPTWPNRFFAHAATSDGNIWNVFPRKDLRTVFHDLEDAGYDWAVYFHDIPHALALRSLWPLREHFRRYKRFAEHAATGSLPAYSFIEPRYFTFLHHANDQHPPHDVDRGEELIAAVYATLRMSPSWQSSLLLITYDEHGGCYDHAPVEWVLPPGDSEHDDFGFDVCGVRVPAVVVSPYIEAGKVDSTMYEHASIPALLARRFGLAALTDRDAAANTFEDLLSLDEPRDDTPEDVSVAERHDIVTYAARQDSVPTPTDAPLVFEPVGAAPLLSEFQESLVEVARQLEIEEESPRLRRLLAVRPVRTEAEGGQFAEERVEQFLRTG